MGTEDTRKLTIDVRQVGLYAALGLNTALLSIDTLHDGTITREATTLEELKQVLAEIALRSTFTMQGMWDVYSMLSPKLASGLEAIALRVRQRAPELKSKWGDMPSRFVLSGDHGHFVHGKESGEAIRSFEDGLARAIEPGLHPEAAILLLDQLLDTEELPIREGPGYFVNPKLKDMRLVEVVFKQG
jgi:hypothetical protein